MYEIQMALALSTSYPRVSASYMLYGPSAYVFLSHSGFYPVGRGRGKLPHKLSSFHLKELPTIVQITIEKGLLECQNQP